MSEAKVYWNFERSCWAVIDEAGKRFWINWDLSYLPKIFPYGLPALNQNTGDYYTEQERGELLLGALSVLAANGFTQGIYEESA